MKPVELSTTTVHSSRYVDHSDLYLLVYLGQRFGHSHSQSERSIKQYQLSAEI